MWTPRSRKALAGLLLTAAACAGAADDMTAERARIAAERAAVEARARADEGACAQAFAVSACVNEVRAQRRAAMQQLDRQRVMLDDQQRKQRAAERLARVREKQQAAAAPKVELRTRASAPTPSEKPAVDAPQGDELRRAEHAQAAASAQQAEDRKAGQRAAEMERRRQEAVRHREDVARRNQARADKGPAAKPLPPPAAAASAPR